VVFGHMTQNCHGITLYTSPGIKIITISGEMVVELIMTLNTLVKLAMKQLVFQHMNKSSCL
jgi:hypothetical protein